MGVIILALDVAANLVVFTGPAGQRIWVNPQQNATLREPTANEHFAPGVKCLILMSDGKFVGVVEDCDTVAHKLASELP